MNRVLMLISIVVLTASFAFSQQTVPPKMFDTPEAARDALVEAAETGGEPLVVIFGSAAKEILRTGDPTQDKVVRERFVAAAKENAQLRFDEIDRNRATLIVGVEEWPFGVPLVKKDGKWFFDAKAGKTEIRNRVIGRNELDAIDVCRGYVEAQQTYASKDWNGNGFVEYAARFFSTPGHKDGLYWDGDDTPVAAAVARAAAQGYRKTSDEPQPFHGYYFKILTAQGPSADDGAREYMVKGMMIGGFALVAWPAEYGVSGIKSFTVNQDGVVFEKDLGRRTAAIASAMTKFDPDESWDVSSW